MTSANGHSDNTRGGVDDECPTITAPKPVHWYRSLYAAATIGAVYVIWTLAIGFTVKGISTEEASLYFNEPYDLESVNNAALGFFMISGGLAVATAGVIALIRRHRMHACRGS